MLRKIYFSIITLLLAGASAFAQNNGAIKVLLKDKTNGETIPFANVVAYQGGVQVGVGTTDMDGYAMIKPLAPGKYDIKGVYVGYQAAEVKGVLVGEAKTAYITIELSNGEGVKLDEVVVVEYQEPLIDPDTKSGGTVTREEYQNMATKNINSVAATTAGVFQADEGSALNVRGGRSNNTTYFVDGVKVIGGLGVPQQGVEQLSVITGGLPAQYGDATSGVISVTTRGPQSKFFGGIELISSQLTDKYGYNSIGFSVGGPIWQKKDSAGNKTPVIGFFLSGQGNYEKDPSPSYVPVYKIKDDKLKQLEEKPLRVTPTGDGLYPELLFVTKDDMEQVKAKQNVAKKSLSLNGKLDFKVAPNTNLTLGGAFDYANGHDYIYTYTLFNANNNSQTIENTWRAYARINQKFGTNQTGAEKEKAQALISNAFFTFLASYEKTNRKIQDDSHKDNVFNYGYIGKFNYDVTYKENKENFSLVQTLDSSYYLYDGRERGPITFERSEINATSANYTSQAFDFRGNYTGSIFDIQTDYGQLNGDRPNNINDLFSPTGRQYNGFSKNQTTQLRFASNFSADLKDHALMVGFEYDQRDIRGYQLSPMGLWTRMRDFTNSHFASMDDNKANWVINQQYTNDAGGIKYYERDYVYNPESQKQIDKSLREHLGLAENSQVYINTDALTPDELTLDMFSAEDLLGNGVSSTLVDYFGYDYLGNVDKNSTSIDGFMTNEDAKGNKTFNVGAFKPIYVAGYIQDKFDFKDIKFNVGLRVDRFDANQKVLKDKYLFHEAYTAGEVESGKPSNIKDDYVVYVDDYNSTKPNIVGYRDGNTWYDVEGKEVSDSKLLVRNGKINPYLKDANFALNNGFSTTSFQDYKPQINLMPRVAFSFPISDAASFVAHYDVLTQRPTNGGPNDVNMRFDPRDYYFIYNTSNNPFITNSNLLPEKTVDYELGYNQVLNEKKNAALKIAAFYREMRNQVTLVSVVNAFPKTYQTYANQDFGTVKGLSLEFDLRRTNGVALTANYTLQFADGSGSSANSGANLANSSQPNLRVTLPLDYDQRHNIVLNLDYRFGEGKDYKGPQFNRKKKEGSQTVQVLQNVGANLIFRLGSGTPYTRYIAPSPIGGRTNIAGSLNGSNMPWQFRSDFRLDKNIELTWGKKDSENRKTANLNIYLQVLNLFNSKNILNVYNYTGDPDDDGYITSPLATTALAQNPNLAAFSDQYSVYLNNPSNYARPRTIRIGVLLDF
jgi:hypothetical protein